MPISWIPNRQNLLTGEDRDDTTQNYKLKCSFRQFLPFKWK